MVDREKKPMTSKASAPCVSAPTKGPDAGCDGEGPRVVFPEGQFYSCTDPETLTCTEPEEALEEYLDSDLDPRMTVAEVVKSIRARPITVYAYKPMEPSEAQIKRWSERLVEALGEDFGEEYADPDGSPCDCFPDDADAVMLAAVKSIISRSRVWACSAVGKATLTPDQVEEVMREYRPDRFEEPKSPPEAPRIVRFEEKP